MRNWSELTPNLSSWINALLLAAILIIATSISSSVVLIISYIQVAISLLYFLMSFLISFLPQFIQFLFTGTISLISSIISTVVTLLSPLIFLLPIPIIAFAHHYLYLLLDRYYPDIPSAERGRITGYFPGIVSWWHGLYGLLIIILALLVSDSILSILPWLNFDIVIFDFQISDIEIYARNPIIDTWIKIAWRILAQPIYQPLMRLVIWVVAAAYLYQFEFTFRQHLIATASDSSESDH